MIPNRSHPFNLVRIDVIGSGLNTGNMRIGGLLFHMHDLLRGSPASGEFPITGKDVIIGSMSLELTFSYGIFGYGISQQVFAFN